MNQGKLEVVNQEMARVNINLLGISRLRWTGMGEFNAIMVNKRVRNAVLGCNLKNDRMISVSFQGKPFNITVIQVYAPTSNAEECSNYRTIVLISHASKVTLKILKARLQQYVN